MRNEPCGVAEEKWIDWHAGKLDPEEMALLRRHRDTCSACEACSRQWEMLLGGGPVSGDNRTTGIYGETEGDNGWTHLRLHSTPRSELTDMRTTEKAYPPPSATSRLKRRLRTAVVWYGIGRKWSARWRAAAQRPAWLTLAGTGVALVLFAGLLLVNRSGGESGTVSPERYAELHEPNGAAVMSRPDTVVYKLDRGSPGTSADTKETVWINVRTHEMFLLLEGMLPSDSLDVQAWAQSDGGNANLGLLQFHQNQAHLYSRNVRPELWKALLLTIEPKGGSRLPTTPQTASIRLNPQDLAD
ncbi:anti-sigma factor [Cohnella zeiphila]|uniref:Anti-sigma factor n=1 Tax=Cohnella zeiphila TaxID=2761120 RepID=A0A7X0SI80_9BACL|nr:anti-sigma factor [Cohnella zeiphila]MBB6730471.1 anti-sigma factor [Cohnella zeiphila]